MVAPRLGERLSALRARGAAGVSPLWVETLDPAEALARLADLGDGVSRLQTARFLRELGRYEEAETVLAALGDLPPGLAAVRDGLRAAPGAARTPAAQRGLGAAGSPLATKTLAELHLQQGDPGTAISMYREILVRDPSDETARGRLEELTAPPRRGAEKALDGWLDRVRRWRRGTGG